MSSIDSQRVSFVDALFFGHFISRVKFTLRCALLALLMACGKRMCHFLQRPGARRLNFGTIDDFSRSFPSLFAQTQGCYHCMNGIYDEYSADSIARGIPVERSHTGNTRDPMYTVELV